MIGLELVAGFLTAWLARKARKVARGVDAEVDAALDAGLAKLHEVVAGKLAGDPSLQKLEAEAAAGTDNPRTRDRVTLAIEDVCETDSDFADTLRRVLDRIEEAQGGSGAVAASDRGVAIGGDVSVHAEQGSAAAVQMGNVSLGGDRPDPPMPRA